MRLRHILILLAVSFTAFNAHAQLVLGGNITWECQGGNNYEITFTLYRDCSGTTGEQATMDVFLYPSGCGSSAFSGVLNLVSATEISDLCPTELANSSCAGVGFTPGTNQVVYSGVVTLAPGCQWNVIWNSLDWSMLYENMNPVFLQDGYIHTIIDTNYPCADSPDVTSSAATPQVPYICNGTPYVHNAFLSLPPGFSASYSLVPVQTTGATASTSVNTPGFVLPAGMTINPLTGIINWTPSALGYYAVGIEIDVINGGNVVGTIYENMTFIVRDCNPTNTEFVTPDVTSVSGGAVLTGNNNISACVGDSIIFTVQAENPDLFRGITLSYTNLPAIPFTFVQTGVNPAVGTFSALATSSMINGSPHVLQIHAEDDACPNPDIDDITVNITVSPNIALLTNDTTICLGQSVNLQASGLSNNNYTWTVLAGGDNTPAPANNVASQNVTPDFTTSYRVSAVGIPASCVSADTVTVSVALTDLTFATNSESCGNLNGSIDITVVGDGSGNYNYDWTGAGTVDGQDDQSNLNGGVGVTYSVTVTDNVFGCTRSESVSVGEIAAPVVNLLNDTTICSGGSATLLLDFTAGTGPFNVDFTANPVANSPADLTGVNDGHTLTVSPTATTTYTIQGITDAFGCTANPNESVTVTVRNPVTSNFLPESAICVGGNLVLDIDHSQAGSYSVVYSIGGTNQPAVVVADNGTIDVPDPTAAGSITYDIESVSYNDAPLPACPSADASNGSINVTVNALPTAAISAGGSVCAGDCINLTLTLTGTGPWTVSYTRNNIAMPDLIIPAAASPYNYVWQVCPASTSTYCITAIDDNNCSNTVSGQCATVTVNPYPVVNFSVSDNSICESDCIDLDLTVSGSASTFTAVFTDTPNIASIATVNNANSPYSQNICLTANQQIRLDSVYFTGAPQCATVLNQTEVIDVNGDITVTPTDTICNAAGTQYQVIYTISGGELPYDENPAGAGGNFNGAGTQFTTVWVNSSFPGGPWIFSDGNDCNSVSMSIANFSCPVLTDAGTMSQTPIVACGTTTTPTAAAGTWNNDGFLDGNDQQMFILTTVQNGIGQVIASDCNDAVFGDADSPLTFGAGPGPGIVVSGVTYYITSVAGDDSGAGVGGCVNLGAVNVQVAQGQPVTWYQRPSVNFTISDNDICEGECSTVTASVSPNLPFSIRFHENPDDPGLGLAVGQNSPFDYIVCPTTDTDYTLDSVFYDVAPQCATIVNQTLSITVNEDISVAATDTVCNNISTQYQVIYTISGGELPYDEDPAGANGSFNGAGTVFTTNPVNSGSSGGPWVFSDVNNCNSVQMTMNPYSCPVLSDAPTMSATPLVVCGATVNANAATATYGNDFFLDGNDQMMFILHTASGNAVGATVISTDCDDASFGDADSPLVFGAATAAGTVVSGTTYYISAVVGDDSGVGIGGCVNLAAPNVQVAAGTPVTFYQSATASIAATGATTICQGQTTALQVTFTGPGPWTFVYSIDGTDQPAITVPAGGNPYSFNVGAAGDYCLESVTNTGAACSGTVSGCVTIAVNPLPTAVFDGPGVTCAGTDYCFDVDFTGTAPWSFTVNDPDAVNDVVAAVNADPYQYCVGAAGPYQIVSVTDGNNCTNTQVSPSVNLVVNALPTVQWSLNNDASFCEGSCFDLTIVNTGAASFDIDIISADPAVSSADLQNIGLTHTITVCEEGSYEIVSVTDNNGCVSIAGDVIALDEIPTPVADAGPDLDQCVGLPITIGTAAVVGQTYAWNPALGILPGQTDDAQPNVNQPNAGTYTYTVTASVQQCSSQDQMTLTVHDYPDLTVSALDDDLCFNTCTDITVSGADNYAWDASPSITTALNGSTITVCPANDETFIVTGTEVHNLIQCESSAEISIVVADELLMDLDYSDELCYLQCDGFANFTPIGGFTPYEVNGDDVLNWTDLCAGDYDYTLTDSEGCELTGSFTINERPEEIIDVVTPENPVCFGEATGSIELTDASATSFSLDAPPGVGDQLDNTAPFGFYNLPAGDYIVYMAVTLPSGLQCADTTLISLESLSPELNIDLSWNNLQYCFGDEVCAEAEITGGFGGLIAHWNECPGAAGCEVSTANPYCFIITGDTTLYVYGTDQNLCASDTIALGASLFPEVSMILQGGLDSVEVCEYSCVDLFTEINGGNGNVTIDWYEIPVDNAPFATDDSVTICPFYSSPFVDYYVIASDGCSEPVIDTIRVVVHDTPEVIASADTLGGCYPLEVGYSYIVDPGFADNASCTWSTDYGVNINYCGDTSFVYNAAGQYFPAITLTSEYGCVGTDTIDDPVIVRGFPEIDFTWDPQPVDVLHLEVQFTSLTEGADSLTWNFYNTGTSHSTRPRWTFPDIETDDPFVVCLEAVNQYGCADTLCQDVFLETVLQVFVPNCFTPDEDGINDVFIPIVNGVEPGTYKFWIFNRWGDPVFYTEEPGDAWTGEVDGGEYYVPDGVYAWRMECQSRMDNKVEVFEGHVTVLR